MGRRYWCSDERRRVLRERIHQPLDDTKRRLAEGQLQEAKATIDQLTRKDVLTGLPNRKALEEDMEKAVSFAGRWHQPLSLIMTRIDCLSGIRSSFGNVACDEILASFAGLINASCRVEDTKARLGDEEFVILLPNTTSEQSTNAAKRLRQSTELLALSIPETITASFGITQFTEADTEESLLSRASQALSNAEKQSPNRIEVL